MSTKVLELQTEKGRLIDQERGILATVEGQEGKKMTVEQRGQFDGITESIGDIDRRIASEQRQADIQATKVDRLHKKEDDVKKLYDSGELKNMRQKAFEAYILNRPEMLNNEERTAFREAQSRGQEKATDSKGGYLTPVEFDTEVIKTIESYGGMLNNCRVRTTTDGNTIKMGTLNDTSRKAVIIGEGVAASEAELAYGQKSIGAYKYTTGYFTVSNEILADEFTDITGDIAECMGDAFYRGWNDHLTLGNGSSQPEGIVTGIVAANRTLAAAATAMASDLLIDLVHKVNNAYRKGSKFMLNDITLGAIRKLKDGQGNYLWQMGDITKGVPDTLLGYPVEVNYDMPNIGANATSVIFGDIYKAYTARKAGSMAIRRSTEIGMLSDELTLVGFARLDGKLVLPNAVFGIKHAGS